MGNMLYCDVDKKSVFRLEICAKLVFILFHCPKIRKTKYACFMLFQSDVYVLNVPSMAR